MARRVPKYRYAVYGVSLGSDFPLNYPKQPPAHFNSDFTIRIVRGSSFNHVVGGTVTNRQNGWERSFLPDGSVHLRWPDLAEFLVSPDGREITSWPGAGVPAGSWQTYLLGQVLSFALVKNGIEPLHATVVVVNGSAVGFLGSSGQGKSTLAAVFLQTGHRLLTDDLLVLHERQGVFWAYPGPNRLKLFPDQARHLLGDDVVGVEMNGIASKHVIPLRASHFQNAPVPLHSLYVLHSPGKTSRRSLIRFSRLRPRRALIELLRHTFNRVLVAPSRLQQQFEMAALLATKMPVKRLSYTRDISSLSRLREAVLADLGTARLQGRA